MVNLIQLTPSADDSVIAEIRAAMDKDGYVILRGLLPADASRRYGEAMIKEYERLTAAGWTFTGGGHLEGHLNINPGREGAELVAAEKAADLSGLISRIVGEPMHLTAMAGNLAMAGSHAQNFHADSNRAEETWVANITLVPTSKANGAMELIGGTRDIGDSYAKFRKARLESQGHQPTMEPGDILLRLSTIWHRGTVNPSNAPRPMGMFAYRPVSQGAPTFTIRDEPLTIRSNRYYGKFAGMREFAAIRVRPVYELLRVAVSMGR